MTPDLYRVVGCTVRGCRRPTIRVRRTRGGIRLMACKHLRLTEVTFETDGNLAVLDFRPGIVS